MTIANFLESILDPRAAKARQDSGCGMSVFDRFLVLEAKCVERPLCG